MEEYKDILQILLHFSVALVIAYYCLKLLKFLTYWRWRRVPYIGHSFNFSTTDFKWMYFNESRFMYFRKLYEKTSPHKYCGYYNLYRPTLLIRDPQLAKNVLATQFENFSYRRTLAPLLDDHFFHFLFNLNGRSWKTSRKVVEPAFTVGKLKNRMFEAMLTTAMKHRDSLAGLVTEMNTVDMNTFTQRYIVDMMFACLYEINSNAVPDPNSVFLEAASHMLARAEQALKLNIAEWILESRHLGRYMGMSVSDQPTDEFYEQQLRNCLKLRKENGLTEVDLVQHFINLTKSKKLGDSDEEDLQPDDLLFAMLYTIVPTMLAMCVINTTFCCALYEIAYNSSVQRRLHEEIDEQLDQSDGLINYDNLRAMTYLKNVLLETFRKYPTTPEISRICNKTGVLSGTNMVVEEGILVLISVSGMHYDPEFYPQPETFDPDRFEEEAKKSRHPYCYLPFSGGPRSCIGEKLVKLLLEVAIVSMLSKYEVSIHPDCKASLEYEPRKFFTLVNGIKLQFVERRI